MRYALTIAFLLKVVAHSASAQSLENFEAAIIRPSDPQSAVQFSLDSSRFIVRRFTLQLLIETSYPDLPTSRLSGGPSWASKDLWDLVAKLPAGTPADQEHLFRATERMLRNFLVREFSLKTHFVQREQPVYNLVLAKGGPKFKISEDGDYSSILTAAGIEIRHGTMQEFASTLFCLNCPRQRADRPVFDKTGLDGYYDFTLDWSPSNIQSDDAAAGPSIFTALEEQLGLKLQPQRAPVDFLIIDQAERPQLN